MKILSVIVSTRYGVVELSLFGIGKNKTIREANTWELRVIFFSGHVFIYDEDKNYAICKFLSDGNLFVNEYLNYVLIIL